jgi:hypothetical protein
MRILLLTLLLAAFSCTKSSDLTPEDNTQSTDNGSQSSMPNEDMKGEFANQKVLLSGLFKNDVHPTSGEAKIYESKDGVRTLVFENFKTDAGPDLRIYLSNDKALSSFTEISMKVENGNKSYVLPTTLNINKQNFVLIWCKRFTVLFGHSELKK